MSKTIKLNELKNQYSNCLACILGKERQDRSANVIFGEGNIDASIMVIGESPGPQEEDNNMPLYPFAPAGDIFTKCLAHIRIKREDIYITNSMICAPLSIRNNKKYVMDSPTKIKVFGSPNSKTGALYACNQRLIDTINIINPNVIVLLGAVAYSSLFGEQPKTVSSALGKHTWNNYNCYLTYHPSFYARKKALVEQEGGQQDLIDLTNILKKHWEDILELSSIKKFVGIDQIKDTLKISKILQERKQ